ncbi:MAG: redox-regulated ATPase YchF [bacterium]
MDLGIVGLPNVGKSTLFNALTENEAPAENYPFCTVDPNVGVVPVPDKRLDNLSQWVDSDEATPAAVEFTDIAGLVENAHEGEGLGNQFLAQIRSVDAVCHVLRLFDDSNVTHVQGTVDPLRDIEILEAEFALADLGVLQDPLEDLESRARAGDDESVEKLEFLREVERQLTEHHRLPDDQFSEKEKRWLDEFPLLSRKPVLYVLNVSEETLAQPDDNERYRRVSEYIREETPHEAVTLSAQFEVELLSMDPEERPLFLEDFGLESSGLERLVRSAYDLLGLITFFTYNENELRAWSLPEGSTAGQAAGNVHSDFQEQFIRAEVINYSDFKDYKSWNDARENGAVRSRGEDYRVRDGDILLIQADV